MVFSSSIFLYWFLPLFLAAYYLTPRRGRSLTLSLASFFFYGWWRPDFVGLMLISTVVDYRAGIAITAAREKGLRGRGWLLFSVVVNLGLLSYFKYANFAVDSANQILLSLGFEAVGWTAVVLPVGISFYTFQTMSYTIDVYRGVAARQTRFVDFMSYVVMFPQLVAGPIVRYNTIADQLRERTYSWQKVSQGVLIFQCGFAKKILIADSLAPLADEAFSAASLDVIEAWLGLLAYTFQIYFDFSGYSDMAIGLGLMMGFRFPINFDSPYRSIGITEFWQRWHISLSTWLRDYLYLPLGGNRRGSTRTYVNLALVMLLGGLWHGANWTFLVWGAYHGGWLILERRLGRHALYAWAPRPIQILLTFVITAVGWSFFRAADIGSAMAYLGFLFAGAGSETFLQAVRPLPLLAMAVAAVVVWVLPNSQTLMARGSRSWALALQPCFALAVLHLHYQDHIPFLYFQF